MGSYESDIKLATIGGRPGTIQIRDFIPVDKFTDGRSAIVDGSGIGTIEFGPVQPGYSWEIGRIAVTNDGAATTSVFIYLDAVDDANIVEYTPSGNDDIADENQPIFVPGGSKLIVRWTGATVGSRSSARIQGNVLVEDYRQLIRGQG